MNALTIFVAAAIVGWISATIACAVRDARRAAETPTPVTVVCTACATAEDRRRQNWDFALWEQQCTAK